MKTTLAASPRCALPAALLLGLGLLLSGCPEDNPDYCSSDDQCKDPSRAGYDPSRPHCHGEGNFCYEGCAGNQDCADTSKSWYQADRPFCDPVTSDCVAAPPADGGQDGDGPRPDGAVEAGQDAGDAGVDVDAPPTKLDNGETCQGASWCKSGYCADKVCCDKACTGTCEACDVAGSKGTCAAILASAGPQAECPGDSACGNGSCDNGNCTYPKAGQPCGASTCSAGQQTTPTCDATHTCQPGTPVSCGTYTCDSAGKSCLMGCQDSSECVSGSACDRSKAHLAASQGLGTCLDKSKVVVVGATEEIVTALAKVTAAKPYVAIPPKTTGYTKALVLDGTKVLGKTVHLIGTGSAGQAVILKPSANDVPGISVGAGMTVTVQGLQVQSASGATGDGIYCQGSSSSTSTLAVLESTIQDNKGYGISGTFCDVTLRRNLVLSNQAGGAKLSDGTFVIVNNVVAVNGNAASAIVGGLNLSPTSSAGNVFYNNTVANNAINTSSGGVGGLKCFPSINVINSIVYGNGSQISGCAATYSDVEAGASGTGNINQPPDFVNVSTSNFSLKTTSPCINKGTATTTATAIDLTGGPRQKGSATDMGAYEVQ